MDRSISKEMHEIYRNSCFSTRHVEKQSIVTRKWTIDGNQTMRKEKGIGLIFRGITSSELEIAG